MSGLFDKFERIVRHPDLRASEVAMTFIRCSGEAPNLISGMHALLADDVWEQVRYELDAAPTDEVGWANFLVVIPEVDSECLTKEYRLGVEAIREYLRAGGAA